MPERFVQDLREPRGALAENPGIIDVLIKLDRQKNKKKWTERICFHSAVKNSLNINKKGN